MKQHATRSMYYEYIESSIPTDQTVILVHGLGSDMTTWDPIIPLFHDNFHLLRYDLTEHGKSDPAPSVQELTWSLFVDDLFQLVQPFHIKKCHLVGHGFGGTLALQYAKAHPESVRTLTLISMHMTSYYTMKPGALDFIRSLLNQSENAQAIASYLAQAGVEIGVKTEAWTQRMEATHSKVSADSYLHLLTLIANTPTLEYTKSSSVPVFLIFGKSDPLTSNKVLSTMLAQDLADKRTLVVPDAYNWVHYDHPELVAQNVIDFCQSQNHTKSSESNPSRELLHSLLNGSFDEVSVAKEKFYDLEVTCLGAFRVKVEHILIQKGWNQRFAKEILVYLVLHGGATRSELCELFWSTSELALAKSQLRVALSHLRKLLDVSGKDIPFIVADHDHIYLNGKIKCDAIELQKSLDTVLSLAEKERAIEFERLINDLPPPPLFSGLHHEGITDFWYSIEAKLQKLLDWCLHYYAEQGEKEKAWSLLRAIAHIFPGYEPPIDITDLEEDPQENSDMDWFSKLFQKRNGAI